MTKPTTVRLDDADLDLIAGAADTEGISVGQWIARRAADEALRLHIARWHSEHPDGASDPATERWDTYQDDMMTTVLREDVDDAE